MDNSSESKYLSSKDAGALLGYTHDYISRLCRQGKIVGIQKGREWYVTREELDLFQIRHQQELVEKKKELSKKFSKIRREAEARKRQARLMTQNQNVVKETDTLITDQEIPTYEPKPLTFAFPKQMIAVLACVFIFTASLFTNNSFFQKISEINEIVYSGIEQTIYSQATIIPYTASVFESIYNHSTIVISLPQYTYSIIEKLGSSYLVLYILQGQSIYYSFENLYRLGTDMLIVYEFIGQLSWYGLEDVFAMYKEFFNTKLYSIKPLSYIYEYMDNVKGGFVYIKADMQDMSDSFSQPVFGFVSLFKNNITQNVAHSIQTFHSTKNMLSASVSSVFEFNLIQKEEKIRVIKLEQ